MTVGLTRLIESVALPPGILLLAIGAGLLISKRRPQAGQWIAWGGLLMLYLLSIPAVSLPLVRGLENRWPALSSRQLDHPSAQAIVVLAGGRKTGAPEYGSDTVSHLSLSRIRYAAWLYRRTHLPIITSGGIVMSSGNISEAGLMTRVLEEEFGIPVLESEEHSRTTMENALEVRKVLQKLHLNQVYLVTHAFHMPRAVASFAAAGVEVIPAPTAFTGIPENAPIRLMDYLPQGSALQTSCLALHEYAGMAWYRLKGLPSGSSAPESRNPDTHRKAVTEIRSGSSSL